MNRHVRRWIMSVAVLVGILMSPIRHGIADSSASFMDAPQIVPATISGETFVYEDPLIGSWPTPARETIVSPSEGVEAWNWQLLPDGLLYKSYLAGEKEPRLSNSILYQSGGQTLWDTTLGWRVGLIRFGTPRAIQPEGFQLDVEGGTFMRSLPGNGSYFQSMDIRAGLPLTWREGPFQTKLGVYHVESHVGDDFLAQNPGFVANGYSRTAFVGGFGYYLFDSLRLYSEVGWSFARSGGDRPWEWQSGLEWCTPDATGLRGAPYFAANVHLREATHGSGSVNVMAGWQWRRTRSDHLFRVGVQYFNGKNNQYSFLQDTQQLVGFGVRYDY